MHQAAFDRSDDNQAWARFWEFGQLSSLGGYGCPGTYGGAIRGRWREFFGGLPTDSRVLDIGTGNGAIPAIAVEVARERGLRLEIHGIDSAPIRPMQTVRWHRELIEPVRFHGRVAAESTPFPGGHFQALSSQFAFEYTDMDATARELGRLAAPGAGLMLVIHHPESAIVAAASPKRLHARLVLDDTRFFDAARALLEYVADAHAAQRPLTGDPEAERRRRAFNLEAKRVAAVAAAAEHPDLLQWVLAGFRAAWRTLTAGHADEALRALDEGREGVRACRARLDELVGVSLDRPALEAALAGLESAGFAVASPQLFTTGNGELLGWLVTARRRAG